MDDLDHQLIGLLRSDSRKSAAALAQALGVSRGTVQNRIDKLTAGGVIQRFTIATRTEDDRARVRAIMSIEIEGERSKVVVTRLRRLPEVVQVHTTNGRWDLIAELDVATLAEFSGALDAIRAIEGITATETSILLAPQF